MGLAMPIPRDLEIGKDYLFLYPDAINRDGEFCVSWSLCRVLNIENEKNLFGARKVFLTVLNHVTKQEARLHVDRPLLAYRTIGEAVVNVDADLAEIKRNERR